MRRGTYRIALGGVLSAAAVGMMMLGSIIPFATFISPAAASVCVLYFCVEFDRKTAVWIYAVIAVLSLLFAADKELALLFACVIGHYPIVKLLAEKLRSKILAWAIKLIVFNGTLCALYYMVVSVFVVAAVREEFKAYSTALLVAMLVMGNIAFLMFDRLLTVWSLLYIAKLQPKLDKHK